MVRFSSYQFINTANFFHLFLSNAYALHSIPIHNHSCFFTVTIASNTRDSTTVVLYDNKDEFDSQSISNTSELSPVQTEEEEVEPQHEPSPPPEPTPSPPPELKPKHKPLFILEPVNIPAMESSSDEVMVEDIPARDSMSLGDMSSDHVEIEYDLDDEPEEPAESDESDESPGYVPQLDIVNSRLLEPVHSQGDKSDVEVDLVPFLSSNPVQESDPDLTLSKEVSDWLATEVLAKAVIPHKKSVTPEPKVITPEPSPLPEPKAPTSEPTPVPFPELKAPSPEPSPTPEPSPGPPPEPKRNLSKEVSDWLNDNVLGGAKQAAADRKFSREVSDWLQKSIIENAKPAADLSKNFKPTPPEPATEPSPPPRAGSHAGSPEDRLFSPLENYPNDMDEDTSKHTPTVPLMVPSQVSKEDVPLRDVEDYPPLYSSHDSTPSSRKTSDSKSPSPKLVVLPVPAEQPEKSPSATGSRASSPGDRLFSPLEDHPSDSPNVSPSRAQSKTPSPKPGIDSSEDKGNAPSPSRDMVSVSLTPSSGKVVGPKAIFNPAVIPIEDKEHVSSPERDSSAKYDSSPIRDELPMRERPSRSNSPISEQFVQLDKPMPRSPSVRSEEEKRDTYVKSDGSINNGSLLHPQIKFKSSSLSSEPVFLGVPVGQDDRASLTESDISGWLNESILMPATAESWVENKILKKAQVLANEKNKYSGEPESITEPKTESSRSPKSMGVQRRTESLKKDSLSDQRSPDDMEKEVEDWTDNEVLIPAQVENWVGNKILNPAEKQRSPVQKQIIPSLWAPTSTSLSVGELVTEPRVEEIENWISSEVIEPAKAASWVQSEVLQPAEVSVAVEDQILGPASIRASDQSHPATAKSPKHKDLRFGPQFMKDEEGEAVPMDKDQSHVFVESKEDKPLEKKQDDFSISYEPKVEQPIEQKPIVDDSLSWVDSSLNVSPFQPHPDHPGDPILQKGGDVPTRLPQFSDEKSTPVTHGQPPQSSTSPYQSFYPTPFGPYGQTSDPSPMLGMPAQSAPVPTVGQPQVGYGQPAVFSPSRPALSSEGTLPSNYGRQPYDTTAQPFQVRPYPSSNAQSDLQIIVNDPTFVELPPTIPAQLDGSSLEPSSVNVASSQAASPLKREDSNSLLTSKPQIPSSQIGVEPSWGTEASRYDKQEHDSNGIAKPEETEKTRESILKNAAELLEAMHHKSSPSKAGKSETRSSLIEKRAIQQDNYLTRDDDEDYKPRNKPSKRRKSSSSSDVHRRRSDSFLSDMQSRDKSPSVFRKLWSPLAKIINKHKSPTRTNKSAESSYDSDSESYDYNPPPIPTKEPKVKNTTMLQRKSHSGLVGETSNLLSAKSVRPEPIKEESDENNFELQQPDASTTGQPAQISNPPIGPTPPSIPDTVYRQLGPPFPMDGQPPQGFLSNANKELSQHSHPSSVPYQVSSGAPPPGSGYPEDIQTSALPKFSDYSEAAKRRLDPERGSEGRRIPNPPKKGFPTFPDYDDLIAPKDKLAAKDQSWFDAEKQPASTTPTTFESEDTFPEGSVNSLAKRISEDSEIISETIAVISEDPSSQASLHVDTSTSPLHSQDVSAERNEEKHVDEKSLPVKRVKPMAPGNGVPLFQDYYDLPAGEFPLFLDSPMLAPYMDKRQLAPTTARSLQPQNPSTQPLPIGLATPSSQHLQRPWEIPSSTPQGSATRPAELGLQRPEEIPTYRPQGIPVSPNITRYSYSHPDRHLSELLHPSPPAPPQVSQPRVHQQGSNLYPEARLPVFQTPNPIPQPMKATPGQTHGSSKLQPTDEKPGQQSPSWLKPDFHALENPTTESPSYMTSRPQRPWEIPSTVPYSTTGHLTPSMGKPGDYDQRQMFDPQGLPKQTFRPWTSTPDQEPYSASSGLTPTGHHMPRPGENNQQQINYPQSFPTRTPGNFASAVQPYSTSPGQMPSMGRPSENNHQQNNYPHGLPVALPPPPPQLQPASAGQTPQTPTFTKHYYSKPDRPISELLQLHPQNPQQDSPQPNFQDAYLGKPREHSPLPPGAGVPKFSDYDELVQVKNLLVLT